MIDLTKTYRTREEKRVRNLQVIPDLPMLRGEVEDTNYEWNWRSWKYSCLDLIEVKEKP